MKNLWIVIVTLVVGLFVGWFINGNDLLSKYTQASNSASKTTIPVKELELRNNMRKLWEDHITWTRLYMISNVFDHEDKNNVAQRLLQNQEDLGNAIKPYYGEANGNRLTQLLKEHISLAVKLIDAAKINDQQAIAAANDNWYKNGNDIADFLSTANPDNWPRTATRAMMKEHLDLTKQEALNVINDKTGAGIADYDRVHDQILRMADMLSEGIVKQFPDKF